ncbi:hypothetical protein [Micromonospora sp. CPCC 206061]|uniref:hypothetical protein n=1 Tax=Micromonospora sp. CPCC 206061 TaxID=3122410 RepID=UPI002FF11EA4
MTARPIMAKRSSVQRRANYALRMISRRSESMPPPHRGDDADLELLVDLLNAAFYYRLLLHLDTCTTVSGSTHNGHVPRSVAPPRIGALR